MIHCRIIHLLPLMLLVLSGCGGGGGGSGSETVPSSPPVVPATSAEIIANAKNYTPTQLRNAANSLANAKYTGNEQTAAVNIEMSQAAIRLLLDTESFHAPALLNLPFATYRDTTGAVNTTIICLNGGTMSVIGQLNPDLQGNLTINLNSCSDYHRTKTISGTAAITINSLTKTGAFIENSIDAVIYYDNVSFTGSTYPASVSGYVNVVSGYNPTTGEKTSLQNFYTTVDVNDESVLMKYESSFTRTNTSQDLVVSGDIYMFDIGKLSFTSQGLSYLSPNTDQGSLSLSGDKTVTFDFGDPYIKYSEDTNNDGNMDVGVYFADGYELLNSDAGAKTLLTIANMSIPPSVGSPRYDVFYTYATTDITVKTGDYNDPDNPHDDLTLSFIWYLNGDVIADQNSNTFPARIAVFYDLVSVSMVVSDGINVAVGAPLEIRIADSPLEVLINNVPENVRTGDLVSFIASISDPDDPALTTQPASSLIDAPTGATINENGEVSWQVPSELSFPMQTFSFTFAGSHQQDSPVDDIVIDIDVQSSSQSLPLARKGMESPKNNHSLAIGDFNSDGLNEILSTDSASSIFLLAHEQDSYTQIWTYPFKVGSGKVVQVLAADLDNDDALEIVVISEKSISVIYDLQSMAVELFSTEKYIKFAQIADTNADDALEIAYLVGSNENLSDDAELFVVSLDSPATVLFSANVDGAIEVAFGNVDNDSNLELITNNGFVYDTNTWQIQWFSSNVFGSATIALGDFTNDGIDEIAGADEWGNLAVYSAVERTQLAVLDKLNTCSLTTANIDSDSAIEIIRGDCQRGNITAYNLAGNQLEQVWSTSNQSHGSISLVSGDSDNDGEPEVHWGTGVSSSGADLFTGADLNVSMSSVSPKSQSSGAAQLDSYHSAGWSNVTDNDENAIFFAPGASGDTRLVYMKPEGSTTLGRKLNVAWSGDWSTSNKVITTDFNNDGFGDIFLPLSDFNDVALGAMQLSNESIHWQSNVAFDDNSGVQNIGVIRAQDISGDGFDDALFVNNKNLTIIDMFNQTNIANLSTSDFIIDFAVFKLEDEINIAVAHNNKTTLYTYNGTSLLEQSFIEEQCDQLFAINYDTDAATEILCLSGNTTVNARQVLIVYEIQDNTLVEAQRKVLNIQVFAIVVDPSTSFEQGLLLAANFPSTVFSGSYGRNNFIANVSNRGNLIWRSPLLIGASNLDGLKARITEAKNLELMFSTNEMMYWIK